MRLLRLFTLLATVGLAFGAVAQSDGGAAPAVQGEAATTSPQQPGPPVPIDCAPKAAVYQADKGLKLWMVRQGKMMLVENPLRPLTRDEVVVLDVVVNSRRATAFGVDFDNLHQAGTPKSVEREGREPIQWKEAALAPPSLRVLAEDGRVLLGPMPFVGCEDAPAAKAVADKPVPVEKPVKGKRKPKAAAKSKPNPGVPSHLPQGALTKPSLSR